MNQTTNPPYPPDMIVYKEEQAYCKLAFTQSYTNYFRFGVLALQGYTMEFDTTTQTINYAPSAKDSLKVDIKSSNNVFTKKLPVAKVPLANDCYQYGTGCISAEVTDKLWIAKLTSCLGGAIVWFCILFWGVTCLPDLTGVTVLLSKTKKAILH